MARSKSLRQSIELRDARSHLKRAQDALFAAGEPSLAMTLSRALLEIAVLEAHPDQVPESR